MTNKYDTQIVRGATIAPSMAERIAAATRLARMGLSEAEAAALVTIDDRNPVDQWTAAMRAVYDKQRALRERIATPKPQEAPPPATAAPGSPSPDVDTALTLDLVKYKLNPDQPSRAAGLALIKIAKLGWRVTPGVRNPYPDKVREAMVSAYHAGARPKEIHDIVGCADNTIYRWLTDGHRERERARKKRWRLRQGANAENDGEASSPKSDPAPQAAPQPGSIGMPGWALADEA